MTKKKIRLVVFNWKENPQTFREASRLIAVLAKVAQNRKYKNIEIVACPPLVYLAEFSKKLTAQNAHFSLGAQDVFWENRGAYTGEIGPAMLRSVGKNIRYVIVGHSERRRWLGETDDMVNKKIRAAIKVGMRVILCVGEPAKIRKKGIAAVRKYIKNQLKKDLRGVRFGADRLALSVAYEPIWAIGTGENADPRYARDMAVFIKKETQSSSSPFILYGGSVDGADVADYLCYHEINGVLVGGASLRTEEIRKVIKHIS